MVGYPLVARVVRNLNFPRVATVRCFCEYFIGITSDRIRRPPMRGNCNITRCYYSGSKTVANTLIVLGAMPAINTITTRIAIIWIMRSIPKMDGKQFKRIVGRFIPRIARNNTKIKSVTAALATLDVGEGKFDSEARESVEHRSPRECFGIQRL